MKKYKDTTQKYIDTVTEYLSETYGTVKPEWQAVIEMLGYNLDLFKDCKKSIKDNGLYDRTTGKKNPLLTTIKDLQATIMKQVQHLGLSPYAVSKIKKETEDDTEDYIDSLTRGDE
jgi:phage terminase small subunit